MLELEDNPIPPTFMLLPYEDGMAFAGQHTAASWLDECQRRLGRAKRSASLHRKMALMFLCEVDAEDHAWVDGYDHVIHEPFLLEVPGRTLTTLAPALRVMNGLLGVAGAAGAVAGLPLPRKLPFGLASSDAMQLLGGLGEYADQMQGLGDLPDDLPEDRHQAYASLEGILPDNWKVKCNLKRLKR